MNDPQPLTIGVLALQGAFREHIRIFERLGYSAVAVRQPKQLNGLDGLVIPGGESTTIGKLAVEYGLLEPIRAAGRAGTPLWGTCAGLVMLAEEVGRAQPLLALMPMSVSRNGFGRQISSFEIDLPVPALGPEPFRSVFIRAPRIEQLDETQVVPLAMLPDGTPVAVQQGHLLATAFHPELTDDPRWHEYFIALIQAVQSHNQLVA